MVKKSKFSEYAPDSFQKWFIALIGAKGPMFDENFGEIGARSVEIQHFDLQNWVQPRPPATPHFQQICQILIFSNFFRFSGVSSKLNNSLLFSLQKLIKPL